MLEPDNNQEIAGLNLQGDISGDAVIGGAFTRSTLIVDNACTFEGVLGGMNANADNVELVSGALAKNISGGGSDEVAPGHYTT